MRKDELIWFEFAEPAAQGNSPAIAFLLWRKEMLLFLRRIEGDEMDWGLCWMGGLWAAAQPMAPPKEANQPKPIHQFFFNERKKRERNEDNWTWAAVDQWNWAMERIQLAEWSGAPSGFIRAVSEWINSNQLLARTAPQLMELMNGGRSLLLFSLSWAAVSSLFHKEKDKPFPTILHFFESTKKEMKSCGMRWNEFLCCCLLLFEFVGYGLRPSCSGRSPIQLIPSISFSSASPLFIHWREEEFVCLSLINQ